VEQSLITARNTGSRVAELTRGADIAALHTVTRTQPPVSTLQSLSKPHRSDTYRCDISTKPTQQWLIN